MSIDHFSHEHPLILKEQLDEHGSDDQILCYACHAPIFAQASATADVYICGGSSSGGDGCDDFYLHKKCTELPKEIQHPMHDRHPLSLHARPLYSCLWCYCEACGCRWEWFTYNCHSCNFDCCVKCAFDDRAFRHVGHPQHGLTLMQREALFKCDACGTEAKDSSYACNSCQFWMHKSCASSPTVVETDFHHHPLVLTYYLPDIHRTFRQFCRICNLQVHNIYWLYYCYRCTYFVHIKCVASSTASISSESEYAEEEQNVLQLPVETKESFLDLIIDQFAKAKISKRFKTGAVAAAAPNYPQTIDDWSHEDHPLILLEEVGIRSWNNNEMIICNGCVLPISPTAHPMLFYGCIKCHFFLHIFCVDLPPKLAKGVCPCHPKHPLFIHQFPNKYSCVQCDACGLATNGFYYVCKKCNIMFDVGCCLVPNMIEHESHKHPLINSKSPNSESPLCDACGVMWTKTDVFKCETRTCVFQIHKRCALLPSTMRHRWDPHPIPLIYPPFFYEGPIYCEICEEEVNANYWFYHCCECDHSFHSYCIRQLHNAKLGDRLLVNIHRHTITFVKKMKREYGRSLTCFSCNKEDQSSTRLMFECANCDILFCDFCVWKCL